MRRRYIPWQSLRQRWHREEQRTYGMRLLEKSGRRSFVSESSHGRPCAGVAVALWRESPLHTFRKQLDFLSVCTRYSKDLTRMSNPVRICPDGRLRTVASTFFDLRRHLENLIAKESMQGALAPTMRLTVPDRLTPEASRKIVRLSCNHSTRKANFTAKLCKLYFCGNFR